MGSSASDRYTMRGKYSAQTNSVSLQKGMQMKTINGRYASAAVFTANDESIAMEDYAAAQLQMLCDNITAAGCRIRVMPDVHPGKVATIGLTMTVGDCLMPGLIGLDIGCGITLAQIKGKKPEFQKLDTIIREHIPSGFAIREKTHRYAKDFSLETLRCFTAVRESKALLSLGTLGGGNHFIEIDKDEDGALYAAIHTGSRHLGKEMTDYYMARGQKRLKEQGVSVPYELTYLEGELKENYLHDLQTVQAFASLNRLVILDELAKGMKWKILNVRDCIHNYVDASAPVLETFHAPMLRKGAISAQKGEFVAIPINMKDGIILGKGLGNPEWNCSAPHGSGRLLNREAVKSQFTVSAFKAAMKGIYCSCISKDTLDEAPFAYRPMDAIAETIQATVEIEKIIRPVYSFKAG